jgi:hypothetical protein
VNEHGVNSGRSKDIGGYHERDMNMKNHRGHTLLRLKSFLILYVVVYFHLQPITSYPDIPAHPALDAIPEIHLKSESMQQKRG